MGSRRRRLPGGTGGNSGPDRGGRRLLVADAGMLAGFRRAEPSLEQLDDALADLEEDDLEVAVVADAGLKRDLSKKEQDRFETYRSNGTVVCAAAGTKGGHTGFMRAIVDRAVDKGAFGEVLVLTARDLGGEGPRRWTLARLGRVDGRWALLTPDP